MNSSNIFWQTTVTYIDTIDWYDKWLLMIALLENTVLEKGGCLGVCIESLSVDEIKILFHFKRMNCTNAFSRDWGEKCMQVDSNLKRILPHSRVKSSNIIQCWHWKRLKAIITRIKESRLNQSRNNVLLYDYLFTVLAIIESDILIEIEMKI